MESILKYLYILLLFVSLLITSGLIIRIFRRKRFPGRAPFIGLLVAVFLMDLVTLLQLLAPEPAAALYWARRAVAPGSFTAFLWCLFAIQFSRSERPLTLPVIILMMTIPTFVSISITLNVFPELIYSHTWLVQTPLGPIMEFKGGAFYWIMTYAAYGAFLVGTAIFIRSSFRKHRIYVRQSVILTVAAFIPFITDITFIFNIGGLPRINLLPVAVSISALIIALTVERFGLFQVMPFAHELVFRNLTDGAIVVDIEGRIVNANPVAVSFLGSNERLVGEEAGLALKHIPNIDLLLRASNILQQEVELKMPEHAWVSAAVVPFRDDGGRVIGRLLTFRNITRHKHLQQEQERLLADLQEALNKVRTLQDLLPICANCKRIRDDKGYWTQVEAYVVEHTEATFSHGVCPTCFAILAPGEPYPDDPRMQS